MSIDLKKKKIIFIGTPDFSVPILSALIDNYNVISVVTQPDKKVGRKQEIVPSSIKKIAQEHKIKVLQPEKIKNNKEFFNQIKDLKPDLIIVVAYGFILPQELLDIPKYGVINIHASLLPKYRGASPIQAAILNGDDNTGVTVMLINDKMDEGDILVQAEAEINTNETFKSLHDKLSILSSNLLIDTLPQYFDKKIKPQKQDDAKASYCQLITKEDGKIDWSKSAEEIERMVRAFDPWPGTWTNYNSEKLKVHKVEKSKRNGLKPGEVFLDKEGLAVQCGQDALQIKKLQLAGKKVMTDKEFLNGYQDIIGSVLN